MMKLANHKQRITWRDITRGKNRSEDQEASDQKRMENKRSAEDRGGTWRRYKGVASEMAKNLHHRGQRREHSAPKPSNAQCFLGSIGSDSNRNGHCRKPAQQSSFLWHRNPQGVGENISEQDPENEIWLDVS